MYTFLRFEIVFHKLIENCKNFESRSSTFGKTPKPKYPKITLPQTQIKLIPADWTCEINSNYIISEC